MQHYFGSAVIIITYILFSFRSDTVRLRGQNTEDNDHSLALPNIGLAATSQYIDAMSCVFADTPTLISWRASGDDSSNKEEMTMG